MNRNGQNPTEEIDGRERRLSKLESLKCWPEVKAMLENASSVRDIVHFIQNERYEYLDVKPDSLQTCIYQWLNRHGQSLRDVRIPTKFFNTLRSTDEKVDPLDAVNILLAIQMDRILDSSAREAEEGKIDRENSLNIRLANEIIKTIGLLKSDGFKHSMAIANSKDSRNTHAPLESYESVKRQLCERFGEKAATVALDPTSRAKIFTVLNKIRTASSPIVQDLLRQNGEKVKELEAARAKAEALEIQAEYDH